VKRRWLKWVVMNMVLICLFQDHQFILTSLSTSLSKEVLILYYKEGCPYASEVLRLLLDSIDAYSNWELSTQSSTPHFPSPTLRIPTEDFYINYIGEKAIKEAIKTRIFN
jgi:hypothetical protein